MKCEKEFCHNQAVTDRIFCTAHGKSAQKYEDPNNTKFDTTEKSYLESDGAQYRTTLDTTGMPDKDVPMPKESENTIIQTSNDRENEAESIVKTGPHTQRSETQNHGWIDDEETEKLKTQSIANGMRKTENKNYSRSANAERNGRHGLGSPELLTNSAEERSRSMNLIDESTRVLLDCMKSAAKNVNAQKVDFQQLNAIANLGKQIGQLARVSLDAIRESRK